MPRLLVKETETQKEIADAPKALARGLKAPIFVLRSPSPSK